MDTADPEQPTFGARFLEEWKRRGGPISAWSYAEIQQVRASDREGLVRNLRKHEPHNSYPALQLIRSVVSPEILAARISVCQQGPVSTDSLPMLRATTW
jgi:hypothetical protein